jgi:hypothetical protein
VRDAHRRHRVCHKDRSCLLAARARGIAAARWGDPGIDKDEIEFDAVEAAAQRGNLGVVVDVEMFSANVAAGLLRQLLQAALAGRVAHRPDHIPAAAFQFHREPQPQPARRPNHQRPAVIHVASSDLSSAVVRLNESIKAGFKRRNDG